MAIDFGAKRVGVASTDETGRFALPRAVLKNDKSLLKEILEFVKSERIERVVIGESRDFKNLPNPIMQDIEKFKKELEAKGLKVILHPEILTTVEARRVQGGTNMTDASAAALILKNYVDTMYNVEQ